MLFALHIYTNLVTLDGEIHLMLSLQWVQQLWYLL